VLDELGDVILAGVAHNNPNYDPGWGPFFAALVVIAGCAVAIAGGVVYMGMPRLEGRRKWRTGDIQPGDSGVPAFYKGRQVGVVFGPDEYSSIAWHRAWIRNVTGV